MVMEVYRDNIGIIEVCGNEAEAKKEFMGLLKTMKLDDIQYEIALLSWQRGFNKAANLVHDAVGREDILIIVNDENKRPFGKFNVKRT